MPEKEFSIYLEQYNAVYIDIAKVASSSLKATFSTLLELDLNSANGNPHNLIFPRPPQQTARGYFYPGTYTFAFVRNPWDRLVSCYRDKIEGQVNGFTEFADSGVAFCMDRFNKFSPTMTFEQFILAVASIPDEGADEHFKSQYSYLVDDCSQIAIDFVGRYENIDTDFQHVANEIGLPPDIKLPTLQANVNRVNYTDYYSPVTRSLVSKRFAHDIELFSYQFK